MYRPASIAISSCALAVVVLLGGCSSAPGDAGQAPVPTPNPTSAPSGDAAGSRLAFGLHDQADGSVQALGVLEWRDLEGGFWAVIGGTEATGDAGKVVAVIADVARDDATYVKLAGRTVRVSGTRLEGASIRMAGPEMSATAIEEVTDSPGPAQ